VIIRFINDPFPRKLAADTEPSKHISAIGCYCFDMSDEVVVDAARTTELVKWSPVFVEWLTCSWIDDVLNELFECHWAVVLLILAISHLDGGSGHQI